MWGKKLVALQNTNKPDVRSFNIAWLSSAWLGSAQLNSARVPATPFDFNPHISKKMHWRSFFSQLYFTFFCTHTHTYISTLVATAYFAFRSVGTHFHYYPLLFNTFNKVQQQQQQHETTNRAFFQATKYLCDLKTELGNALRKSDSCLFFFL